MDTILNSPTRQLIAVCVERLPVEEFGGIPGFLKAIKIRLHREYKPHEIHNVAIALALLLRMHPSTAEAITKLSLVFPDLISPLANELLLNDYDREFFYTGLEYWIANMLSSPLVSRLEHSQWVLNLLLRLLRTSKDDGDLGGHSRILNLVRFYFSSVAVDAHSVYALYNQICSFLQSLPDLPQALSTSGGLATKLLFSVLDLAFRIKECAPLYNCQQLFGFAIKRFGRSDDPLLYQFLSLPCFNLADLGEFFDFEGRNGQQLPSMARTCAFLQFSRNADDYTHKHAFFEAAKAALRAPLASEEDGGPFDGNDYSFISPANANRSNLLMYILAHSRNLSSATLGSLAADSVEDALAVYCCDWLPIAHTLISCGGVSMAAANESMMQLVCLTGDAPLADLAYSILTWCLNGRVECRAGLVNTANAIIALYKRHPQRMAERVGRLFEAIAAHSTRGVRALLLARLVDEGVFFATVKAHLSSLLIGGAESAAAYLYIVYKLSLVQDRQSALDLCFGCISAVLSPSSPFLARFPGDAQAIFLAALNNLIDQEYINPILCIDSIIGPLYSRLHAQTSPLSLPLPLIAQECCRIISKVTKLPLPAKEDQEAIGEGSASPLLEREHGTTAAVTLEQLGRCFGLLSEFGAINALAAFAAYTKFPLWILDAHQIDPSSLHSAAMNLHSSTQPSAQDLENWKDALVSWNQQVISGMSRTQFLGTAAEKGSNRSTANALAIDIGNWSMSPALFTAWAPFNVAGSQEELCQHLRQVFNLPSLQLSHWLLKVKYIHNLYVWIRKSLQACTRIDQCKMLVSELQMRLDGQHSADQSFAHSLLCWTFLAYEICEQENNFAAFDDQFAASILQINVDGSNDPVLAAQIWASFFAGQKTKNLDLRKRIEEAWTDDVWGQISRKPDSFALMSAKICFAPRFDDCLHWRVLNPFLTQTEREQSSPNTALAVKSVDCEWESVFRECVRCGKSPKTRENSVTEPKCMMGLFTFLDGFLVEESLAGQRMHELVDLLQRPGAAIVKSRHCIELYALCLSLQSHPKPSIDCELLKMHAARLKSIFPGIKDSKLRSWTGLIIAELRAMVFAEKQQGPRSAPISRFGATNPFRICIDSLLHLLSNKKEEGGGGMLALFLDALISLDALPLIDVWERICEGLEKADGDPIVCEKYKVLAITHFADRLGGGKAIVYHEPLINAILRINGKKGALKPSDLKDRLRLLCESPVETSTILSAIAPLLTADPGLFTEFVLNDLWKVAGADQMDRLLDDIDEVPVSVLKHLAAHEEYECNHAILAPIIKSLHHKRAETEQLEIVARCIPLIAQCAPKGQAKFAHIILDIIASSKTKIVNFAMHLEQLQESADLQSIDTKIQQFSEHLFVELLCSTLPVTFTRPPSVNSPPQEEAGWKREKFHFFTNYAIVRGDLQFLKSLQRFSPKILSFL